MTEERKMNELMNRICKRISELVKENVELVKENAELKVQIEKMKKDFSNALDSAYSNQALYELWKRWECKSL